MRSKNRLIFFGLAFFCALLSFSQDITIVGGTVKCPAPLAVGYDKTIGPKTKNGHYIALGDVITTTPYPPHPQALRTTTYTHHARAR